MGCVHWIPAVAGMTAVQLHPRPADFIPAVAGWSGFSTPSPQEQPGDFCSLSGISRALVNSDPKNA